MDGSCAGVPKGEGRAVGVGGGRPVRAGHRRLQRQRRRMWWLKAASRRWLAQRRLLLDAMEQEAGTALPTVEEVRLLMAGDRCAGARHAAHLRGS
jgi:hypothetical protein